MTSNLISSIDCPICHKPLMIYHDRNNMKLFAKCGNRDCNNFAKEYYLSSQDLELLFYREYYKENNGIERSIQ